MKNFLSIGAVTLILMTLSGCSEKIGKNHIIAPEKTNDCTMACAKIVPSESTPQIESLELEGGMYYGMLDQKKKGTPEDWVHVLGETKSSAWRSPKTAKHYDCDCNK